MLKEPPQSVVAWSDPRLRAGYFAIILAAVIGFLLLSRVFINSDEYLFAGQARTLLQGRLLPIDGDPLPGAADPLHSSEGVRFPPGWPLLLVIGALWGVRGMFVITLAAHLMGGAAVARMMVRRGLPSVLAAVWLFHPLFWSFSRTLMSDIPATALLLLAMDAWENGRLKTASAVLAYSFLIRIASFNAVAGFALAVNGQIRKNRRALLTLMLGIASGAVAILLVNWDLYGHPLRTGDSSHPSLLTTHMLGENTLLYVLGLVLIPPFPLLCLLLRPRSCDRWALLAVPVLLFFVFWGYHEQSPRLLETFLGGQRYILAAHAALLIATASVWSRIPLVRFTPALLAAGVVGVTIQYFSIKHLVNRYEPAAAAVASCHPTTVAYNQYASRVALSSEAKSYHLVGDREPPVLPDIVVISFRQLTNRFSTPVTFRLPDWVRRYSSNCQSYGEFLVFDLVGQCSRTGNTCFFPSETR